MRHAKERRCKAARCLGLALFAVSVLGFTLALHREVGVHLGSGSIVSIGNASLQVGYVEGRLPPTHPRGVYVIDAWHTDWSVAWRPFHALDTGSRVASWHLLVIPLWPLMPIGAALAAYAHGVLVGMKRARTSECPHCGYDLRKTPFVNGFRTCPECGNAATLPASSAAPV